MDVRSPGEPDEGAGKRTAIEESREAVGGSG